VVWLLQALGLDGEEDVFTIYIGDDTTDEDAFQVFLDRPVSPHAAAEATGGGGVSRGLDEGSCHCANPDAGSEPRAAAGEGGSTGSASGGRGAGSSGSSPRRGLGIVVTEERKATWGAFTLRNPLEVAAFLRRLIDQ